MLEGRPAITLVASRTIDRFPLTAGGPGQEIPGGPATYMGVAFQRLHCAWQLITGATVQVEVLLDSGGEQYLIPRIPLIPLPERFSAPATILSPIMREIDPDTVPETDGLLVIDLQGFVREPSRPSGEKGAPVEMTALLRRAAVVKASREELSRLTPSSLDALSEALLLITCGEQGAIIRRGERQDTIPARPVAVDHAVGAGDIFLATFVHALVQGSEPIEAGHTAARFVEGILQERLRQRGKGSVAS